MKKYSPALALVFIFLFCISVFTQTNAHILNLESEGSAAISQNDIAGTRNATIQLALQKAIQEALSGLLSLPVQDKKFLAAKNKIINEQERYISKYKITAESEQTGFYFVNINVAIALRELTNDLGKMGFRPLSGNVNNYKMFL